ncbi:MAG: tRNA (N(6)-L-threonylcarbamoyladenosine(37)-C(2))-methylthiotransferase MtaB [Firmicutes bacterium]|nr:tRNA (N(6)-L-threonylcarbamoyladenosine(37)-C(2))-methylthiotransferase MtaB [Bacillota bacterium]
MPTETGDCPKVAAVTLGCKVNQYDTEAVLESFAARGFKVVPAEEEADAYLINTCTVTNVADKKSRQLVRKIIREHPDAVVAVFGCYTQTQPEKIEAIPGVSIVVGTQRRAELVDLVTEALEAKGKAPLKNLVEPFKRPGFEELVVSNFGEKVRAVLKIQEGCQQFCAYCKVPYARGPERSREVEAVLATAENLIAEGYKEIVLTGIHLASYGRDLEPATSLLEISQKIADLPGLARLRLSSIEPTDVSQGLLELITQHPVVCAHLHLPLQSGSDTVLRRMRRKYTTKEYLKIVEDARALNPDVGVTTDVIVGFPGETDEEYAETVAFVKEVGFSRLHVFPYSRRSGTPAAKMPGQIPASVKNRRSQELIQVGQELAAAFHRRYIGKSVSVLFEEVKEGLAKGYTENYIRIMANIEGVSDLDVVGSIRPVLLRESDAAGARGDIVVDKEVTA